MLKKIKVKIGKYIAKNAPLNSLRIAGLRFCGYKIGKNVYLGEDLLIITDLSNIECQLEIGNNVSIAPRNILILSSHPNKSELSKLYPPKYGKIYIKDNVWLGVNCVILPNVTIGESSIIGMNCVVKSNIEPNTVLKTNIGLITKEIRKG
ncbi:MAG: acyltransferase [Chitinophagales bacterium]|nr:acyltransferase [Chitinophagales bacterium]